MKQRCLNISLQGLKYDAVLGKALVLFYQHASKLRLIHPRAQAGKIFPLGFEREIGTAPTIISTTA